MNTDTNPPLDPIWAKEAGIEIGGYPVVYASLKGSRLYGTQRNEPGVESDIDLLAIYQLPTRDILSLHKPEQQVVAHHYNQPTDDGRELAVDLSAYELKRWLKLLGQNNGSVTEAMCVPEGFYVASDIGLWLRKIGAKTVTKRLYYFYHNYAFKQLKRGTQAESSKGLLHTYREAFFGLLLLTTGEMVFPFADLCQRTQELLSWESQVLPKLPTTRTKVKASLIERAWSEFEYLEEMMDRAFESSPLPDDYDGRYEMNELLLDARYQML